MLGCPATLDRHVDLEFSNTRASTPSALLRGVATLAGGEILARAVAFIATAVLARRLGPEAFGIVGFAAAVCGYLTLAVNSGMNDIGAREVARAPERAGHIYASITTIRLILAAFALALLALLAWLLPKPAVVRAVVLLSGLSFFSYALDPIWALKGLERPALAGFGLVLAQGIYAVSVVVAVGGPADVTAVPVLQFAGEFGAALLLGFLLLRGARPSIAIADGMRLLRSSAYLGVAKVLRTITITFDVVMLGLLATERQVGLYSAAYRFTFLLMSIAAALSAAYLPSYARAFSGESAPFRRLVETSLVTSAAVGAPLVAGAVVMARPLLTLLFGVDYAEASTAFRLLALSVGLIFFHWSLSNLLVASHRTRLQAKIHATAAAVNIVLNFVLIPRYGIVGAATATLIAEIVVAVCGVVILRQMKVLPPVRLALPPLAAAAVMAGAVRIAGGMPVPARVTLGGVVYIALLAALGGLPSGLIPWTAARSAPPSD